MSLTRYILLSLLIIGGSGAGLVYWTQDLNGAIDREGFELGANSIALIQLGTAEKSLERLFVTYDLVIGNNVSYLIEDARKQGQQLVESLRKLERTALLRHQGEKLASITQGLGTLLGLLAPRDGPPPGSLRILDETSGKLIANFASVTEDAGKRVARADISLGARRKQNRMFLIAGSLAYALLILLAGFFVSRVISAPLQDLTEIAKGTVSELKHDDRVIRGPTEFVQLSTELKRLVNSLEQTVTERTHSLESKSAALFDEVGERKKAQEGLQEALLELKSIQATLIQQEKLKAIGEMVSGIAHDFNNILTPIMSYSALLRDDRSIPEGERVECLDLIHTASQDAAGMIRRMRAFSKPEGAVLHRPLDLDSLINDAVALAKPRWTEQERLGKGDIAIRLVSKGENIAMGDEGEIRQALLNLLFNAADAIEGSGVITIEVGADDSMAWIAVSDTGIGMTSEVLAKCREPFFSTKASRGTGLGLPMVFGTAERHGGRVDIDSELGKGTTFTLSILRGDDALDDVVPSSPLFKTQLVTDRAVDALVVDDDENCRQVVGRSLINRGHRMIAVEDAETALLILDAQPIDLMVTDLDMPGMNGDELALRVRKGQPHCFIVILTGRPDQVSQAGRDAANIVLSKPMASEVLAARIFDDA